MRILTPAIDVAVVVDPHAELYSHKLAPSQVLVFVCLVVYFDCSAAVASISSTHPTMRRVSQNVTTGAAVTPGVTTEQSSGAFSSFNATRSQPSQLSHNMPSNEFSRLWNPTTNTSHETATSASHFTAGPSTADQSGTAGISTGSSEGALATQKSAALRMSSSRRKSMASGSDTVLVSSSKGSFSEGGANSVVARLFRETDVENLGFITGVQALGAFRTLGITMKEKDLWELLLEIDVNQVNVPSASVHGGIAQLLDMSFDFDSGIPQPRISAHPHHSPEHWVALLQDRRILMEDFEKLMLLVQSASRFQMFEDRSQEATEHVKKAMNTKFHASDSTWIWCWQALMLMANVYMVMMAIAVFTNTDAEMAQYFTLYTVPDALVTVVLFVDILVKLRCCIVVDREGVTFVIDEAPAIAKHYMHSFEFLVDVLTFFPWRFLVMAGGDSKYIMTYNNVTEAVNEWERAGCVGSCATLYSYHVHTQGAIFLVFFRALKALQHAKYFRETGIVPMTRWYVWRQFVLAPLLLNVARFVVLIHTLAVVYISLDQWSQTHDHLTSKGASTTYSAQVSQYAQAIYIVMYCVATVGYGDIPPKDFPQHVYFMFLTIVGWLFSAYVIGNFIGFIEQGDIESSRRTQLLEVAHLLRFFDVPDSLTQEVISFENYILKSSISKSFGHVTSELPTDMQRSLDMWLKVNVVNTFSLFRQFHRSAKLRICDALIETTMCPEEYVYMIGESGCEMYFITHGFVDVLNHSSELIATRRPGQHFGEMGALLLQSTDHIRSTDAKCLTYCEMFVLSRDDFVEIRKQYPRVEADSDRYCKSIMDAENSNLEIAMSVRQCSATSMRRNFQTATEEEDSDDEPDEDPVAAVAAMLPDGMFTLGYDPNDGEAAAALSPSTKQSAASGTAKDVIKMRVLPLLRWSTPAGEKDNELGLIPTAISVDGGDTVEPSRAVIAVAASTSPLSNRLEEAADDVMSNGVLEHERSEPMLCPVVHPASPPAAVLAAQTSSEEQVDALRTQRPQAPIRTTPLSTPLSADDESVGRGSQPSRGISRITAAKRAAAQLRESQRRVTFSRALEQECPSPGMDHHDSDEASRVLQDVLGVMSIGSGTRPLAIRIRGPKSNATEAAPKTDSEIHDCLQQLTKDALILLAEWMIESSNECAGSIPTES